MKLVQGSVPEHSAHTCHWSVPTLLMPRPFWLQASDSPWCCWNRHGIVVLSSTEGCGRCPMWEARREGDGRSATLRPDGAVPLSDEDPGGLC